MEALVTTLLVISCVVVIGLVFLQDSKSDGLSGAISGGAEQLFGKRKARGMEALLQRLTVVFGVLFFASALALAFLN